MLERLTEIPAGFFSKDGTRLSAQAYVFLMLLCLAFFLPGFSTLPPTDRDELLFAQASKQMVESGNYVDIRFQDQPRYKKPIGIYWLQAASVKLLNPQHLNEIWAYRVPSLMGATLAVVMTAALGALLFGPLVGLLAAIMLAGCLILNVEARLAKTDAALLGSIMVTQYALARAYLDKRKIGWPIFFAFWSALAAGILLKGPIILLILGSTLLWLGVSEKNLRWLAALKPLLGIPYLLLLIGPWFAAIMLASHGQFLQQSAGHDLLGKLWQDQGRGLTPPGLYLLAFPLTFFPFALWALLAIPDSWAQRRTPEVRFCLGWIIPAWIVFELAFAKLPHYVMPLYPAVALLAARALLAEFPARASRRWVAVTAIAVWLLSGVGLAAVAALLPHITMHAWNRGQIAAGCLLLIAQGVSLTLFLRKQDGGVIVMAAGSLIFMMSLFAGTLPWLQPVWVSRSIVQTAERIKPCPGPAQIVSSYNEPSLVFLAGTDTQLRNNGDEIAAALQQNSCRVGVVNDKSKPAFLAGFAQQPQEAAVIDGFDAGRTRKNTLSLYVMPAEKKL